eukprot:3101540-Amphidinium_carterae.1
MAEAVASSLDVPGSDEVSELSLSEPESASSFCQGGTLTQGGIFGGPQLTDPGGFVADRETDFEA